LPHQKSCQVFARKKTSSTSASPVLIPSLPCANCAHRLDPDQPDSLALNGLRDSGKTSEGRAHSAAPHPGEGWNQGALGCRTAASSHFGQLDLQLRTQIASAPRGWQPEPSRCRPASSSERMQGPRPVHHSICAVLCSVLPMMATQRHTPAFSLRARHTPEVCRQWQRSSSSGCHACRGHRCLQVEDGTMMP